MSRIRALIPLRFVLAFAALAASTPAAGQAPPGFVLPGPADPGLLERRLQRPAEPRAEPSLEVEGGEPGQAPEGAEDITFVLNELVLEGVTVYGEEELRPLYADQLRREINLAEVFRIAADITTRYRGDGFILSRAVVPAQRIANGTVRLVIIEGFVDQFLIEDNGGLDDGTRAQVTRYATRIQEARPLGIDTLERYLLLADDLPGVSVESVLTPSPNVSGASNLILLVDRDPWEGFGSLDNRGSRFVGPLRLELGGTANSVLGFAERTGLRVIGATQRSELTFGELLHEQVFGDNGLKVSVSLTASQSEPGFTLDTLDVESDTRRGELRVSYPILRSRRSNLSVDSSFDLNNVKTDVLGQRFTDDRLRVVRAGASYDTVDALFGLGVTFLRGEVSQGLDILGARKSGSADLSRATGRSDFTKLAIEGSRLQQLWPRWNLLVGFTGQAAASSLLSAEEFCLGGATFGRAYDTCEVSGDHGLAGRAELQYALPQEDTRLDVQLFGFYDLGAVWNIDAGSGAPARESLASAGIGVRVNLAEALSGTFEVASPLTRPVGVRADDTDNVRAFFSLVARF